jgi:histidinol dehydrogenase
LSELIFKIPQDIERLRKRIEPRYSLLDRTLIKEVSKIFDLVESSGDDAIFEATTKFDNVKIETIHIPDKYIDKCIKELTSEFREAVQAAIANIRQVNEVLMPESEWQKEIRPGTEIGEKHTPLDTVGIYVPATKGPLVSTALMLVVTAKSAGVKNIIVAMPPQKNGFPNPSTVAAASLAGADQFITGNGVGLIAGLTIGTKSIPIANGIFGPGPAGIAAAMSVAFSYGIKTVVGLGPTDCAIIADETADADMIVRNMMCEGEHGPDSTVLFVTPSLQLAEKVEKILKEDIYQVEEERRDYLLTVFGEKGMGSIAVAPDINAACEIVNEFAPEHLLISCASDLERVILDSVTNAGEILLGNFTPFSAANYVIGITAVLPTNGFARSFSGITCKDMLKTSTIGRLSKPALEELEPAIEQIGAHEGFPCHIRAAKQS